MAVLASGSGTLLEAMLDAALPVALVVADRPCRAIEVAEDHGVAGLLVARESFGAGFDRDAYTKQLVAVLEQHDTELVVMAGFGTVLGADAFVAFPGRVLNTHPALLPSFPGMHGVRDALAYGVKVTGVSVFLVDDGVDTGPIVLQEAIEVRDDDDWSSLEARVLDVEHRLLPRAVRALVEGRLVVEGRHVTITGER
jgi:phosphoribosylglycinamide formyltransferase-1